YIAICEQRHVFRAKPRMRGKHLNHPKFASEFPPDFRREISVQLDTSHSGRVCAFQNFTGVAINENTDRESISWQHLNKLPRNFRLNVARALRIKVEANHVRAEFGAHSRVVHIRNAAKFNLYRSHFRKTDETKIGITEWRRGWLATCQPERAECSRSPLWTCFWCTLAISWREGERELVARLKPACCR